MSQNEATEGSKLHRTTEVLGTSISTRDTGTRKCEKTRAQTPLAVPGAKTHLSPLTMTPDYVPGQSCALVTPTILRPQLSKIQEVTTPLSSGLVGEVQRKARLGDSGRGRGDKGESPPAATLVTLLTTLTSEDTQQ